MRNRLFICTALLLCAGWVLAQKPAARETASAEFGGKKVSIEYGRPELKGRDFAELMKQLPDDRMWRAGSEQITTLTTETDLLIGGKKVPAGKYSLYVHCPESGVYSLAVNKALGQPLGKIWDAAPPNLANEPWPHFDYQAEIADQEVARIILQKATAENPVDPFTIKITSNGAKGKLKLAWGTEVWTTEIEVVKSEGSHSH